MSTGKVAEVNSVHGRYLSIGTDHRKYILFYPSRIFIRIVRDASNLLELGIDFSHFSAHVREEQCFLKHVRD